MEAPAYPASFKPRKHSVVAAVRAITARAEATQGTKWSIQSLLFQLDELKAAWPKAAASATTPTTLPTTPPELQVQLERLSQMECPPLPKDKLKKRNRFWGRRCKAITYDTAEAEGMFRSAVFLAQQPHLLKFDAGAVPLPEGSSDTEMDTHADEAALNSGMHTQEPSPAHLGTPTLHPSLAATTASSHPSHPDVEWHVPPTDADDDQSQLALSNEGPLYTTALRYCSQDQVVYARYRSQTSNTYPRYDCAAVRFHRLGTNLWYAHCTCQVFAVALAQLGDSETISINESTAHQPLCDHYSATLFNVALQDAERRVEPLRQCVSHTANLYSVADQRHDKVSVVFVEREQDVYLCQMYTCGGKRLSHRRRHPCSHAALVNSTFHITNYGTEARVDRSTVSDDWLVFDEGGNPVTSTPTFSSYQPDEQYWEMIVRTEAGYEPTPFAKDVIIPQLVMAEDWRLANRSGTIPRLEASSCTPCAECVAADVMTQTFQCWVATQVGLALVEIVYRQCGGCNARLDEVDKEYGLYIHVLRPRAISVAVTVVYAFEWLAKLSSGPSQFKTLSEELKRTVYWDTMPSPDAVSDTALKKVGPGNDSGRLTLPWGWV